VSLEEDTDPVEVELPDLVEAGARIAQLCAYGCTPEQLLEVIADLASVDHGYFKELVVQRLETKR